MNISTFNKCVLTLTHAFNYDIYSSLFPFFHRFEYILNGICMLRSMITLFYLIWIFMRLLYTTTSYQLSDIDNDHIELTQLVSNDNQIRLRCDAKSRNTVESLILLSCPLSKTGVCRENCINPCPVNESKYTGIM
ncbi:hypothetical protein Smp_163940, partial [Schistosoma mansoni]|uniref:hypothetical protein n=1 Tax=Schistosoma mansoni TaxID=6183 RepID=UPI00022DC9D4